MGKLLTALLLWLGAALAHAGTFVLYVNGASRSSAESTSQQALAFKQAMNTNGVSRSIPFRSFPIVQTQVESAFAIQCQKALSSAAFVRSGSRPSTAEYSAYLSNLGSLYLTPTTSTGALCSLGTGIDQMSAYTTRLADVLKIYLQRGDKIVVTSYSQGSFYVEAALALLLRRGDITDLSAVRVVNVASFTATTLNGRYVNGTLDQVVYSGVSTWPFVLPGNRVLCLAACAASATSAELVAAGANPTLHHLQPTYLNPLIKVQATGESLPGVIARLVNESLNELSGNQAAAAPAIVATRFTSGSPSRLEVDFDRDMSAAYSTTGSYSVASTTWTTPRRLVLVLTSFQPGRSITLRATGFVSTAGVQMAADQVFIFPGTAASSGSSSGSNPPGTGAAPMVTNLEFIPGQLARLRVTFDSDMRPGYGTTGSYVPAASVWTSMRTFEIQLQSYSPGGTISFVASAFVSVGGVPMAQDVVYTFP